MILRPLRIEGEIAFVTLTQGYEAMIDVADALDVGRFNWSVKVIDEGRYIYAGRTERLSPTKVRAVSLHKHLFGPAPGFLVDHIDGNPLDCRRSNMRLATPAQSVCNRKVSRLSSLGVKGVWINRSGRFQSSIQHSGVRHGLGAYATLEEASAAYAEAALRLHGEFARLA